MLNCKRKKTLEGQISERLLSEGQHICFVELWKATPGPMMEEFEKWVWAQ